MKIDAVCIDVESASEENGVFTRAHRCTGHRLSRSCSAPAQRLVATPWGPRMTPALYPVNAARYYNATLHQRYNATLHHTNAPAYGASLAAYVLY